LSWWPSRPVPDDLHVNGGRRPVVEVTRVAGLAKKHAAVIVDTDFDRLMADVGRAARATERLAAVTDNGRTCYVGAHGD